MIIEKLETQQSLPFVMLSWILLSARACVAILCRRRQQNLLRSTRKVSEVYLSDSNQIWIPSTDLYKIQNINFYKVRSMVADLISADGRNKTKFVVVFREYVKALKNYRP